VLRRRLNREFVGCGDELILTKAAPVHADHIRTRRRYDKRPR
jgi:hypothetical protein